MRCAVPSGIFALLVGLNSANAQDDLRAKTQALVVIQNAANSICYDVKQGGGQTAAILNGTIDKVADLNIKGSEQLTTEQYHGVVQTDLATTLKFTQDCKKSVFDILVVRMLPMVTSDTGLSVSQSFYLRPRTVERPSIDCDSTNEPVENLLCADADLAEWDGRMGKLYHQKMKQLDASERKRLLQDQRNWIKIRAANCNVSKTGTWNPAELAPAKPCILQMTKRRVTELTK